MGKFFGIPTKISPLTNVTSFVWDLKKKYK